MAKKNNYIDQDWGKENKARLHLYKKGTDFFIMCSEVNKVIKIDKNKHWSKVT